MSTLCFYGIKQHITSGGRHTGKLKRLWSSWSLASKPRESLVSEIGSSHSWDPTCTRSSIWPGLRADSFRIKIAFPTVGRSCSIDCWIPWAVAKEIVKTWEVHPISLHWVGLKYWWWTSLSSTGWLCVTEDLGPLTELSPLVWSFALSSWERALFPHLVGASAGPCGGKDMEEGCGKWNDYEVSHGRLGCIFSPCELPVPCRVIELSSEKHGF